MSELQPDGFDIETHNLVALLSDYAAGASHLGPVQRQALVVRIEASAAALDRGENTPEHIRALLDLTHHVIGLDTGDLVPAGATLELVGSDRYEVTIPAPARAKMPWWRTRTGVGAALTGSTLGGSGVALEMASTTAGMTGLVAACGLGAVTGALALSDRSERARNAPQRKVIASVAQRYLDSFAGHPVNIRLDTPGLLEWIVDMYEFSETRDVQIKADLLERLATLEAFQPLSDREARETIYRRKRGLDTDQ